MSQRKGNATRRGKASVKARAPRKAGKPARDGFSDFMDLAANEGAEDRDSRPQSGTGQAPAAGKQDAGIPSWSGRTENKTPAWAWGMLPAACTLITSVGLFSALTFLYGGNPTLLWDFSSLADPHQIYNLALHPQHVFYAVIVFSTLLLTMVGYRLGCIIGDLKQRNSVQGELLGKLTALRLDADSKWQDPIFKMQPEVESFTAEVIGAWRHQEARLQRLAGLEGECHRLEKALSDEDTESLSGKFEIPVMAMIAEAVERLQSGIEFARDDHQSWKSLAASKGHEMLRDIHDARGWQRFTQDQLNVQGDAVLKASAHLLSAGGQLSSDPRFAWHPDEVCGLLKEIRALAGNGSAGAAAEAPAGELLDRLSKLAFQIGMEVARLGTRGDRLAPMARTLEELCQALRGENSVPGAAGTGLPASLVKKLDAQLEALKEAAGRPERNLPELVSRLGKTAQDAAGNLAKIADSFEPQYERIGRVGSACSELTGVAFDPADSGEGATEDLGLHQFDPFLRRDPEEDMPVVDPFLERTETLEVTGTSLDPFSITGNVIPGQEDTFMGQQDNPEPVSALSSREEKVYDLADFGAVRFYELSDFGARRVG